MNDQQLMQDLLLTVKTECELYLHGTIEGSTPQVHDAFNNALFECLRIQNEVTSKMEQKGWYSTQTVQPNKVQQVEQKFVMQNNNNG